MSDIYLLIDGQQRGPYTEEQVRQSLAAGQIQSDLPAWYEGLTDWVPVEGLVGQREGPAPTHSAPARSIFVPDAGEHSSSPTSSSPFSISQLLVQGQSVLSANKKWMAAGISVLAILIAFFVSSSNFLLRGTYRTADNSEMVNVLSGSEMDLTDGQGTVTGHYTRQGDTLRLVISNQVYHYAIVPEGLKLEGGALYLSSDYFEAVQLCNEGAEMCSSDDYDGAISALNQAISIYPNYARAYDKRGDAERKKGNNYAAEADYKKAVELDPKNDASQSLADLREEEAAKEEQDRQQQIHDEEEKDKARNEQEVREISRRIKDVGGLASLRMSVDSQVFDMSSNPDEAKIKILKSATQDLAHTSTDYMRLGLAYYQLKRYDDAGVAFYSGLYLDPNNATLHNYMGCADCQLGETNEAEAEFDKAISVKKSFAEAYFNESIACLSGKEMNATVARWAYKMAVQLGEKPEPAMDKILFP